MKNVYIKEGDVFKPVGVWSNEVLYDGIWYVRHFDNSHQMTNIAHIKQLQGVHKISNCAEPLDIKTILQKYDLANEVINSREYTDFMKEKSSGVSMEELINKVVSIIVDKYNNLQ